MDNAPASPPSEGPARAFENERVSEYWTPLRIALRAWLNRNARPLADLYAGAVMLLFERALPGRLRFVCHAVREIRNRLPGSIAQLKSKRFDATSRLDELLKSWTKEGLSIDGSYPESVNSVELGTRPARIDISRRVFEQVASILNDHSEARLRPASAARLMFETIIPANKDGAEQLTPVIDEWIRTTDWFMKSTHESMDGDGGTKETSLLKQFELFEMTLAALVRPFFDTVEEIDEVLDEANG